MGQTVYAEENIFSYLKNLSTSNACSTGLILGQRTDSKDFIVLLVRTPEQLDKEIELSSSLPAAFQSVKDVNETWITDHAKHVTKMLPGGLSVLGVFICSSNDIFSEHSLEVKAKNILYFLKKQLSNEPLLHGNIPGEKLLLHFDTNDSKCICKTLDSNNVGSVFKPAELKFQNNYTKWCQISCNFDISQPSFGGNMSCPLKDQLKDALSEVNKTLNKAMIILNDQVYNSKEILETVIKKEKNQQNTNELPSLKANIFIPLTKKAIGDLEMVVKECDVELHLLGVLASQVFISQKSTVEEAISAIKQDVVRSLAARFEMHWDSLVEEEYGSPEEKLSVHEPPRRVSVFLKDSKIAFNDYLFPGEGAAEVITNFKDMLDVSISESDMGKEIEMQGDPMEFYGKSSISLSGTTSDELLGSPMPKGLTLLFLSVFVIVTGIAIALFLQRN